MKPVVIGGPTGSGKSDLALRLALAAGGEIVNCDSVQIYRGFDIGSAKPPSDVRRAVPHHLFDLADADQEFNAADYGRLARPLCEEIMARGGVPILAGGTFFYVRALLSGLPEMPGRDETLRARIRRIAASSNGPRRLHSWLAAVDPVTAARVAPADRHRVERALEVWMVAGKPISEWPQPGTAADSDRPALKIALSLDRKLLVERLDARVEEMYRNGLVEETRELLARFPRTARPFGAIGYREAAAVVAGEMDVDAARSETGRRTRAYAKRQMTWLRSERNVHWLDAARVEETFDAALRLIREVQV